MQGVSLAIAVGNAMHYSGVVNADRHPITATGFLWTEEAEAHIARHGLTPADVEHAFTTADRMAFRRNRRADGRAPWRFRGRARDGRVIDVAIDWSHNDQTILYCVTAYVV